MIHIITNVQMKRTAALFALSDLGPAFLVTWIQAGCQPTEHAECCAATLRMHSQTQLLISAFSPSFEIFCFYLNQLGYGGHHSHFCFVTVTTLYLSVVLLWLFREFYSPLSKTPGG